MKLKKFGLFCTLTFGIFFLTIVNVKLNNTSFIEAYNKNINFEVTAESCVVMDANNNEILYQNNPHKKLLPASITKILTCITALELYSINDYVHITFDMINTIGSKIYLNVDDYILVEDLLYGLMLNSGNDAAKALSLYYSGKEEDFITQMNKTAKKAGMKNSVFYNPSGLDNKTENITTAYDMALLTSYSLKNNNFLKFFGAKKYYTKLEDRTLYYYHKHKLVQKYDFVLGGKTGYTEKAGRTLVTVFEDNNNKIIVVTFNSHNDWQIQVNFGRHFLYNKNDGFTTIISKIALFTPYKPSCERSKVIKDD